MSRNPIKIESTDKVLSARGGLFLFDHLYNTLGLEKALAPYMPAYKIATKTSAADNYRALCLAFVAEAECLDDVERRRTDAAFHALCGHVNAANTYGEFLRAFSTYQTNQLNHVLIKTALKLRQSVAKKSEAFILDIDSTDHVQYGKKMEGVEFNYKHHRCLDSLQGFDQFGFQYWMQVRPGSTFTANSATEVIGAVFPQIAKGLSRYLRADSGYCNGDVFNACFTHNVGFVITMRANMHEPLINRVKTWKRAKRVQFNDGRETEIGHTLYYHERGRQALRVVIIRALKPWEERGGLFNDGNYNYFAWVSNIGEHEMSDEDLLLFYRKRGNAENFIRELKNGYDLKHFPCQKLNANKTYGLIAAFAHNLMRFASWLISPKEPHFAKIIRFRMVNLACQVVLHARSVTFRFSKHVTEEVNRWMTTITSQTASG